MKISTTHPLFLGGCALAIGTLLPSCADPYASQGPHYSTTTYRAGYEVRSLPPGYRTEVIDGSSYYNYNGTYYRQHSGRYVVVEAPHSRQDAHYPRAEQSHAHNEQIITRLPRGYRTIDHRGTRYYQVNDTYYQKRGSGYIIVGRPF